MLADDSDVISIDSPFHHGLYLPVVRTIAPRILLFAKIKAGCYVRAHRAARRLLTGVEWLAQEHIHTSTKYYKRLGPIAKLPSNFPRSGGDGNLPAFKAFDLDELIAKSLGFALQIR